MNRNLKQLHRTMRCQLVSIIITMIQDQNLPITTRIARKEELVGKCYVCFQFERKDAKLMVSLIREAKKLLKK